MTVHCEKKTINYFTLKGSNAYEAKFEVDINAEVYMKNSQKYRSRPI